MTKVKKKSKPSRGSARTAADEAAPTGKKPRSKLKRILLIAVLIVAAWFALALTVDNWVQKSLANRNLATAVAWAGPASWLKPWDGDLALIHAKAARLGGDMESWSSQMQPLASRKNSPAITKELMLGKITLGDFPENFHPLMGQMLDTSASSEVAEAFVQGLLAKHDRENARAILEAWKRDEPSSVQPEYVEAIFEEVIGNRREALTRLAEFRGEHPGHQAARARLAKMLLEDRKYEAALAELSELAAQGDASASTTIKLAQCARLLGQVEVAKQRLDALLSKPAPANNPVEAAKREAALRELALCQLEMGDYAAAAKSFRAAGVDRLGLDDQVNLALVEYLSGDGDAAESVFEAMTKARQIQSRRSDLEVYLLLNPSDEKARRELGKLNGGP